MALLLALFAANAAYADCPAAPIDDPNDLALSFLKANGAQVASASLLASSVKQGTLVYDGTANKLKLCDGTNWITVGTGAGTDTLASLSCAAGEVPKFNGSAWVCAANGGGGSAPTIAFQAVKNDTGAISGTTQKITGFIASVDIGGNFDGTKFTAPVAGTYVFNISFVKDTLYGTTDEDYMMFLYIGGASAGYVSAGETARRDGTASSFVYTLNAGDTAEIYFGADADASRRAYNVRFSGYKLGGGADTLAGLSCSAGEIPKWSGSAWACASGGGSGGTISFTASGSSTSVGNATWVPLAVAQISEEGGDNYNPATGMFTAPSAGYYQFNGTFDTNNTTGHVGINIAGGTSPLVCVQQQPNTGMSARTSCGGAIYLAANDTVRLYAYQTSGGAITPADAQFSGYKINGGSGGGSDTLASLSCTSGQIPKFNGTAWACAADGGGGSGGTQVAFSVNKGGVDQAGIPSTVYTSVTFPVETFDTNNNFDTSTSRFTPTVAGKYFLSASVLWSNGVAGRFWIPAIRKNGTIIAQIAIHAALAAGLSAPVSLVVDANGTTDYFDVAIFQNTGSTQAIDGNVVNTYFSGALLGGGSGSATLAGLTDVDPTGLSNGKVLTYNSSTLKWEPASTSGTLSGGTSGYLGIWSGAATMALSGSGAGQQLFWDSTNHRLGIGTTTPDSNLHVQSIGNTVVKISSSYANSTTTGVTIDTTGDTSIGRIVFAKGGTTRGGVYYAHNASGLAEGLLLNVAGGTPKLAVLGNGNVGIGTTTPNANLHVAGGAGGAVIARFERNDGAADFSMDISAAGSQPGMSFYPAASPTASSAWVIGRGDSGSFQIGNEATTLYSSTKRLTVDTSGNVGIGTTSPASKLQVSGGIQLADDTATCPGSGNIKLGTLRYVTNTLSVCNSGGWSALATGTGITALTGDVTASGSGSVAATIANSVVTNAKLANMATMTVKGNNTGGTAAPLDLTMPQLRTILGSGTPSSTTFLRGDGSWVAPAVTETDPKIGAINNGNACIAIGGKVDCGDSNAGTKDDITTRTPSGFWQSNTPTIAEGWPADASWYHLLTNTHNSTANYHSMQFAGSFSNSNDLFYRATAGSGTTAWNRLWHQGNDGAGSGLDADLLDGLNSTSTATASTVATRDSNADLFARYFQGQYVSISHGAAARNADTVFYSSTDNYIRKNTAAGFRTALDVYSKADVNGLTGGDNLGNHTATTTLALGANALTSSAGTVIDGGGGWHRTYGATGWYNGTYAGGWYMTDATYIRNYGSKQVYLNANITAPQFLYASDERLKTDIDRLPDALERLTKIRGVSFRFRDGDTKEHLGVVAQEVQKVYPQAVATDDKGFLRVDYPSLVGPLIEAVRELKADNDNFRQIIEEQGQIIEVQGRAIDALRRTASGAR